MTFVNQSTMGFWGRSVNNGNIWTSSGVSAGMDVTRAWIEEVVGRKVAPKRANGIDYNRQEGSGL